METKDRSALWKSVFAAAFVAKSNEYMKKCWSVEHNSRIIAEECIYLADIAECALNEIDSEGNNE